MSITVALNSLSMLVLTVKQQVPAKTLSRIKLWTNSANSERTYCSCCVFDCPFSDLSTKTLTLWQVSCHLKAKLPRVCSGPRGNSLIEVGSHDAICIIQLFYIIIMPKPKRWCTNKWIWMELCTLYCIVWTGLKDYVWWFAYDVIKNMNMQITIDLFQILVWPIRP